ncbi:MAG TPA: hypothetical protein VMU96_09425 [Casimicrobiaceae bacterium]|nr:hypothetical protein [Casimicrobiaceae bacterium]
MSLADGTFGRMRSHGARVLRPGAYSPLRQAPGRVRALAALALVAASTAALGYSEERARAYFARELAECSAWYELLAEAPGLDEVTRIRFRAAGISLLSAAADITTEPWALTQKNLAATTIRREMRYSWANYAVVDKEYGKRCRETATDPVARRKYWLDKHD